ncbi:hypothetical protein [Bradyrhizobium sp. dw_411]|uniref:hypothetical protein n=1 Tax=Bradyrhizobium sp. dw_411 TaxID=2720082 RepID=UPI001BCF3C79|nr:hypothetical protein [Bradyrhizobium sp. dw_411]
MNTTAIFGLSAAMSLITGIVLASLYILPRLQNTHRDDALTALIIPHAFRFIGLSFLVPGVVSPSLQASFATPAAYGDLGAAILALIAVFALRSKSSLAIPLVWLFNIWGFADLAHAVYEGAIGVGISPGMLGAAFFIPTVLVPLLFVTHVLIFRLLLRSNQPVQSGATLFSS